MHAKARASQKGCGRGEISLRDRARIR